MQNSLNIASPVASSSCPPIATKVMDYILENFAEDICLEDLAQQANLSKFSFCRRFQRECGITPMRWLWNFRTMLAAQFIDLDPNWSLTDVAFTCGFTSSAHFSRSFKQLFEKSPSEYRRTRQEEQGVTRSKSAQSYHKIFEDNRELAMKVAVGAIAAGG